MIELWFGLKIRSAWIRIQTWSLALHDRAAERSEWWRAWLERRR